jgi:hypothetical protein
MFAADIKDSSEAQVKYFIGLTFACTQLRMKGKLLHAGIHTIWADM